MKKQVLYVALAAALTACSNQDVFDSAAVETQSKSDYTTNFVAKFGKIDPNQTWDFTSGARLGTRAASEITTTKVAGIDFGDAKVVEKTEGWWIFKNTTYSINMDKNRDIAKAITNKLPDGKKHTGEKAVLVAPSNSFTIYPICAQGLYTHDLYVKVGNSDPVKIYSKQWTDYTLPYFNKMKTLDNKTVDMPGLSVEAPVGTPIEIYLDVKPGSANEKYTVGTSTGNAIVVDVPSDVTLDVPNLHANAVLKYVGIEDAVTNPDKDYNDLVLCLVGNPDVPEPVIFTNDTYEVKTSVSKRYMIEDLGATDDFDFNDIVVDVTENKTITHKVTLKNGVIESDVVASTTSNQKAVLRHLGGTLPFELTIGNTTLGEMQGVMGSDPNTEIAIEGWNPEQNNIQVKVNQQSGAVYTITFPKKGTAPMIIAVEPTVEWMSERQSIPSSWWTE